jgi:hypothetical protein
MLRQTHWSLSFRADLQESFLTRLRTSYNSIMARGWESKAVEGQIELSDNEQPEQRRRELTPAQMENHRKKQILLLSRTQVVRQIETSRNERYTEQLNRALADIDAQLAQLDPAG